MQVNLGQVPDILETCHAMGAIPYLEGPPGIGKSEMIHQFREALQRKLGDSKNFFYMEFRGSTAEPTDLVGLPFPQNGRTTWLKPSWWPEAGPGLFFLDEFPQSSPAVMCAFSQIFDRVAEGASFPKDIMIVLAGNRISDGAAVNRIPSHIRNRILHFEIAFSVNDWASYNLAIGTRPEIVAFGKFKPEMFLEAPPKDGRSFMSGRSLTRCSAVLSAGVTKPLDLAMYASLIGEAAATTLTGFLRVCQNLVSPDVILLDPKNAPIPEEKSACIAVCCALAHKATPANFDRICEYALRLRAEDSIMLVVSAIQKDHAWRKANPSSAQPALAAVGGKSFIAWTSKYQDVLQ